MLQEGFHALIVNSRHIYAALQQLVSVIVAVWTFAPSLRAALLSSTTPAAFTPCEKFFRSPLINIITVLFSKRHCFVKHMLSILSYTFIIGKNSRDEFSGARTVDIASDWQSLDFIPGSNLQSCKRYALATKYFRMFLALLSVIAKEDSYFYVATHFDDKKLRSLKKDQGLLYLRPANVFLNSCKRPKGVFPVKTLL